MSNGNIADLERKYMNRMQCQANCIDTNVLIAEIARAAGKTEGIMAPRMIRVADSMPGETSFLIHKTYISLMTNVVPNLLAVFSSATESGRPLLEEGVHYVVGAKKLPPHFKKPKRPVANPKHSIFFCTGHHVQLVSSDMPESSAGVSAVHAFIEEMKLQKGQRLKSRIFPAMRGSIGATRQSPYYLGITGVTDTARIDLGEDNWYEEYEQNMDMEAVNDIVNLALHRDKAYLNAHDMNRRIREEKNPLVVMELQNRLRKYQHLVDIYSPMISEMRRNHSYYIKASSFVNKDFLGVKFFQTQRETLSEDEFLSSICNIRIRRVVDPFFVNFDKEKHTYGDSYKYRSIHDIDLSDNFTFTASLLKYFRRSSPLLLGYDPGGFQSLVVAQDDHVDGRFRIQKEFFVYSPYDQTQLAQRFDEFYGADYDKTTEILLYYDRAGNKRKSAQDQITTDARLLKSELESYGYRVTLMNEGQKTIFYYEHYKLLAMLFSGRYKSLPEILIDENECKNLVSAIQLSPKKKNLDGRIELDKTSETKVALEYQAGLTTQIPSALMYLLYGVFADRLPDEMKNIPELPEIIIT